MEHIGFISKLLQKFVDIVERPKYITSQIVPIMFDDIIRNMRQTSTLYEKKKQANNVNRLTPRTL